jgi:hypothetical protein
MEADVWKRHVVVVILTVGLAACSSSDRGPGDTATSTQATATTASSASASAATPLVGQWQRLQRCSELERVMTKAHLRSALLESIAEDGWIPGVTQIDQIKDPAHPCMGSVARKHSHFFTEDGQFGSLDAKGQQVDDGSYRLVGDDTLVIDAADRKAVTFHYKITGGDTLTLTPVIPNCAPKCFEAGWSVAVASPGYTWHRVQ